MDALKSKSVNDGGQRAAAGDMSDSDLQTSSDEDGDDDEDAVEPPGPIQQCKSMQPTATRPLKTGNDGRRSSRNSTLFRHKSAHKWDRDAVNAETQQMKLQMKDLLQQAIS